jgi:hypothetical protein
MFLPALAINQQMAEVLRNRSHKLLAQHPDAITLLDDLVITAIFQNDCLEKRAQVNVDTGGAQQQAIHAKKLVRISRSDVLRQPLIAPYHEGFVPKSKIANGRTVSWLVAHGRPKTLAVVDFSPSRSRMAG